MSEDDEGTYKCVAINRDGMSDFDEVRVSFSCSQPSDVTIDGDRPDEMYEIGSSLLLKCVSTGRPNPKVEWYRDRRPVSSTPELV